MRGHDAVAATAHRESAKVADRPISTTECRQRIIGLHGELEDTVKSLEEKVAARRAAAGQLHLGAQMGPANAFRSAPVAVRRRRHCIPQRTKRHRRSTFAFGCGSRRRCSAAARPSCRSDLPCVIPAGRRRHTFRPNPAAPIRSNSLLRWLGNGDSILACRRSPDVRGPARRSRADAGIRIAVVPFTKRRAFVAGALAEFDLHQSMSLEFDGIYKPSARGTTILTASLCCPGNSPSWRNAIGPVNDIRRSRKLARRSALAATSTGTAPRITASRQAVASKSAPVRCGCRRHSVTPGGRTIRLPTPCLEASRTTERTPTRWSCCSFTF